MTGPRLPASTEDATHTVQRMLERRIDWTEVVAVVANPDKSVPGHSGRMNHYRIVNGRRLRVTLDPDGAVWTVAIAGRSR